MNSIKGCNRDLNETNRNNDELITNCKWYGCNNLDKFFTDLYHERLKVKTEKSEVKFIKRAIERIVQTFANHVFLHGRQIIESIKNDYKYAYPGSMFLENIENIIKAGSIYDKTRNTYPDEFDFILVLFAFYCESDMEHGYHKFGYTYKESFTALHHLMKNLLSKKSITDSLVYRDPQQNDRKIQFHTFIGQYGCSTKLRFIYERGPSNISINVDIVLSTKRMDPLLYMRKLSSQELFDKEVAKTGSVLYVNEKLAFTETEVVFVKKVMSSKHRKAYRILKYLVNGHKDGEILDRMLHECGHHGERITSHMIKTEVILHHCSCHRVDRVVSLCVLDVLNSLKSYDSNTCIPSLAHSAHIPHFFRSVDKLQALEDMVHILHDMQTAPEPYHFDKYKITPISKSLLTYPRQYSTCEETIKTKPCDWVFCMGTYCINLAEVLLAVLLFVIFLAGLINYLEK